MCDARVGRQDEGTRFKGPARVLERRLCTVEHHAACQQFIGRLDRGDTGGSVGVGARGAALYRPLAVDPLP